MVKKIQCKGRIFNPNTKRYRRCSHPAKVFAWVNKVSGELITQTLYCGKHKRRPYHARELTGMERLYFEVLE